MLKYYINVIKEKHALLKMDLFYFLQQFKLLLEICTYKDYGYNLIA